MTRTTKSSEQNIENESHCCHSKFFRLADNKIRTFFSLHTLDLTVNLFSDPTFCPIVAIISAAHLLSIRSFQMCNWCPLCYAEPSTIFCALSRRTRRAIEWTRQKRDHFIYIYVGCSRPQFSPLLFSDINRHILLLSAKPKIAKSHSAIA